MIKIPLPKNYGSIEDLSDWLKLNIPHQHHIDGGNRWRIITGWPEMVGWSIEFQRDQDATYFNLKWPH